MHTHKSCNALPSSLNFWRPSAFPAPSPPHAPQGVRILPPCSYGHTPHSPSSRYTAFLGALGGTYVGVDEGLAALLGKERCATSWGRRFMSVWRGGRAFVKVDAGLVVCMGKKGSLLP